MSDETKTPEGTGFSPEYVKGLREEAASWRTKYQEARAQLTTGSIKQELQAQGVKAEASWVDYKPEVETAADAVARFLTKHPHLEPSANTDAPGPNAKVPQAMSPGVRSNTNNVASKANGALKGRSLSEIQKDPKARHNLRDQYRTMLREASFQKDNF